MAMLRIVTVNRSFQLKEDMNDKAVNGTKTQLNAYNNYPLRPDDSPLTQQSFKRGGTTCVVMQIVHNSREFAMNYGARDTVIVREISLEFLLA
jgi:hypothetical protein